MNTQSEIIDYQLQSLGWKADNQITLSDLKEELEKARRLLEKGLYNQYYLMTNHTLSGANEETIRNELP